jgi:hypothetical protein
MRFFDQLTFVSYKKINNMSLCRSFLQFICSILVLSVMACEPDVKTNRPTPDISNIKLDTRILRFDQDLFALDTNQIQSGMVALQAKYPDFLTIYASEIIGDMTNTKETPMQALTGFVRAEQLRNLYDSVQLAFPSLAQEEKEINEMLRYFKYYFPERPTPRVLGMISEYATDAFVYSDSGVGISLEMYLKPDFEAYGAFFPAFLRRTFAPEYMPVKLAKVMVREQVGEPNGQRLIDQMINNGKTLYIASLLVPTKHDTLLMGYTREQMEGCYFNEKAVWKRILDEKYLYSTDRGDIRKLVEPSPNAPKVFDEAPGEIGNWIGWQIVDAWMKKHPNAQIADLIAQKDAQKILEEAGYRPRR